MYDYGNRFDYARILFLGANIIYINTLGPMEGWGESKESHHRPHADGFLFENMLISEPPHLNMGRNRYAKPRA